MARMGWGPQVWKRLWGQSPVREVVEEPGFLMLGAAGIGVRSEVLGCSCLRGAEGGGVVRRGKPPD